MILIATNENEQRAIEELKDCSEDEVSISWQEFGRKLYLSNNFVR